MMFSTTFLIFVLTFHCCICTVKYEAALKVESIVDAPEDCTIKAKDGDKITMHYKGTLKSNGNKFDASYDRNTPFTFTLGVGQVIPGWDKSIPGMCVGEKRKLTIPPSLAYGDRGFGEIIPARSTLVFEIELIAINGEGRQEKKKEEIKEEEEIADNEEYPGDHDHTDSFEDLDSDKDGSISVEEMTVYIKRFHDEGVTSEQGESIPEDSVETIVSEIFQEDDKNKDGSLSKDEYMHSFSNEDDVPREEL